MIGADPLWLLRPWWLLAAPLLLLGALWLWRRAPAMGEWERAADPALLAALRETGQARGVGRERSVLIPLAVAALLALALAGPAIRRADAPAFRNLDAVLLAVDLSRSVTLGGALADAQAAAVEIARGATGRPVGLMLYSAEPYLVAAASDDPATLETPISVLDAETMPVEGSRPERALAAAGERLREAGIRAGDVVLISDGGGVGAPAFAEAARIREEGGAVSAIFVAPEASPAGAPPAAPETLRRLAEAGGGVFAGARGAEAVIRHLSARRERLAEDGTIAALSFDDLGRWLVAMAMLPALALWRRGG